MQCKTLFSGKIRKISPNCLFAELAKRVLKCRMDIFLKVATILKWSCLFFATGSAPFMVTAFQKEINV